MKLRDVLTDELNKVMVAESPDIDHLIFCGNLWEPGTLRAVCKHMGRPVIDTQPCGTYLLVTVGGEASK